jgi:hypothetical protein
MTEATKDGVEILSGVPIPHRTERRTYPFDQLGVDECFMVQCDDMKHERSVRSSATRWNKNDNGRRYVVRRMPDTDRTVGVWRVS